MRDRRRYLQWLFEAKKRFGLSVLNYMITHGASRGSCNPTFPLIEERSPCLYSMGQNRNYQLRLLSILTSSFVGSNFYFIQQPTIYCAGQRNFRTHWNGEVSV